MRNDVGMARFMLAAMPFTGHVTPMLAVAEALLERGHSVRFYTGSAFRDRVEASGAILVPWRNAPDFDENDLTKTFPRLIGKKGVRQVMINLTDAFIGTAPAQVKDLLAAWEEEPWDALVTDDTSCGGAFTAEKTDAPWATIAILPLNLPSRHGPPSGLGITPGRGPLGRARDAALRGIRPLLATPLRKPLASARAEAGLPPSKAIFDEVMFSPQLILASGASLLDYERRDRPAHLEFIGRLAATPRKDALPDWWHDLHDRTVVHVTQGTQNIDPGDLIRPTIESLADRNVLVVVATGRRGADELPFTVPSNVRVSGFLPYDALLSHVDAIVTNGRLGRNACRARARHPAGDRRRRPRQARDRRAGRMVWRGSEPQDGHAEADHDRRGRRPRAARARLRGCRGPRRRATRVRRRRAARGRTTRGAGGRGIRPLTHPARAVVSCRRGSVRPQRVPDSTA